MPRVCTVCGHSTREVIDAALVAGEALRPLAARFQLSPSAIRRHQMAPCNGVRNGAVRIGDWFVLGYATPLIVAASSAVVGLRAQNLGLTAVIWRPSCGYA
jgi:hypothetical protein